MQISDLKLQVCYRFMDYRYKILFLDTDKKYKANFLNRFLT